MRRWAPCLLFGLLIGCSTAIQHDLEETQANEILVLLDENGIAGSKTRGARGSGWVVEVPSSDAGRAFQIMQAHGLPRRAAGGFSEVFGSRGLIPTPSEDRMRIQRATAEELERSLMAMAGVVDARVHLVLPAVDRLGSRSQGTTPRAGVLLVYQPDENNDNPINTDACQRLVAGAIDRLDPNSVVVITTPRVVHVAEADAGLVSLGPITVSAGSQRTLQLILGVLSSLVLLLGAALIITLARRRQPSASAGA
jgi:type III secretion protein J